MKPLFLPREGFLYRILPTSKLVFLIGLVFAAYTIELWYIPFVIWGAVLLPTVLFSRLSKEFLVISVTRILPFVTVILGMGVLLWYAASFKQGAGVPEEYLAMSVIMASRTFLLLSAAYLFVITTNPATVAAQMNELGIPPTIVFIFIATFTLVEDMHQRILRIREAQTARILSKSGLTDRVKTLLSIFGPLLQGTVVQSQDRVVLLVSKGMFLRNKKSTLQVLTIRRADYVLMTAALTLVVGVVLLKWQP